MPPAARQAHLRTAALPRARQPERDAPAVLTSSRLRLLGLLFLGRYLGPATPRSGRSPSRFLGPCLLGGLRERALRAGAARLASPSLARRRRGRLLALAGGRSCE